MLLFAAGEDYVAINGRPIEIVRRTCVDITILSDDIMEANEFFLVEVEPSEDIVILGQPPIFAQAQVTIVDSCKFHILILNCVHALIMRLDICFYMSAAAPLCEEGSIRLNGNSPVFGIGGLEFCYKGQFLPVCNSEFQQINGVLACRELNLFEVVEIFSAGGMHAYIVEFLITYVRMHAVFKFCPYFFDRRHWQCTVYSM